MNILITGGAGFIGRALAEQLRESNHDVRCIDNFKTSVVIEDVWEIDLSNPTASDSRLITDLVAWSDIVYHFASSIGVDLVTNDPKGTLKNSFDINNVMFPYFEQFKPKVIFASTSEVYGSRSVPMKETDDLIIGSPDTMRWGYACNKLMSEFLIKAHDFPYTIVRFFNVTGKGQLPNYGMVLPRFIEATKDDTNPLEVYGDGRQIRSFCDIRDAVNVLELLITEMTGEILNIGNDSNNTSILQLAEDVIDISGANNNIDMIPYDERFSEDHGEINIRIPNIDKMKTIYIPRYSLRDIIESMYAE